MNVPEILKAFTPNAQQLPREALQDRIKIGYDWIVAQRFAYYLSLLPDLQLLYQYQISQWLEEAQRTTLECQQFYSTLQFIILDSLQMPEDLEADRVIMMIESYISELRVFINLKDNLYV